MCLNTREETCSTENINNTMIVNDMFLFRITIHKYVTEEKCA